MKLMRKGIRFVCLVTSLWLGFNSHVFAIEISKIRFAATSQKNRMVVDLNGETEVKFNYGKAFFDIVFNADPAANEDQMLPAGALIHNIGLDRNENEVKISVPLQSATIIRYFVLPPGQNPHYRIVVDWKDKQGNSVFKKSDLATLNGSKATTDSVAPGAALASTVGGLKNAPTPSMKTNKIGTATTETSDAETNKGSSLAENRQGAKAIISKQSKKISLQNQQPNSPANSAEFETLQQAKKALIEHHFQQSINLLAPIIANSTSPHRATAMEFTGVALQRLSKIAEAKIFYQKIIEQYPNDKNTARVKLRLKSIEGIEQMLAERKLKKASYKERKKSLSRGSIGGDYRRATLIDNLGNSRTSLSLASLDTDFRGQNDFSWGALNSRISYGRYQDLEDSSNNDKADRLRYLYVGTDIAERKYKIRLGRQRSRGKGIFGRFDGLLTGYQWDKDWTVNVVTGRPVDTSSKSLLDSEQIFYGVSLDIDKLWNNSKLSLFTIQQTIDGNTDRQAIGGQYQYLDNNQSIFGLFDYDYFFGELNAFILNGNYSGENKRRYSWSLNRRKSPYISTRNALIGQAADSFAELQNSAITDDEILDLAVDRTLDSSSASFMYSQSIDKDMMASASLTWLKLSGAPGSGGVPAISESGNQYYLNLYLSASHWYSKADTNQFGFRYSSLDSAKVSSVYASSRYRWQKSWYFTPRIRFDFRDNTNATSQQIISPTLKISWQNREHYFYADLGALFYSNDVGLDSNQKTSIYYAYIGYRFYF